jgi:hypothetical protein
MIRVGIGGQGEARGGWLAELKNQCGFTQRRKGAKKKMMNVACWIDLGLRQWHLGSSATSQSERFTLGIPLRAPVVP